MKYFILLLSVCIVLSCNNTEERNSTSQDLNILDNDFYQALDTLAKLAYPDYDYI